MLVNILSRRNRADIAIDLGTANFRVVNGNGDLLLDEPSVCCFRQKSGQSIFVAAGQEARLMLDRVVGDLQIRKPLRGGVLQDIEAARALLLYALRLTIGRKRFARTSALIGIPADATQTERNALLSAAREAGLESVELILEPYAAAIGAGLPIAMPKAAMIVECGAGTTEVAVLSLNGICLTRSVRIGSASLDEMIVKNFHLRQDFLIGIDTAEKAKLDFFKAITDSRSEVATIHVKGRSLISRLPASHAIAISDLKIVYERFVAEVVEAIDSVFAQIPPEMCGDIYEDGITLTGGGAETGILARAIAVATGLSVKTAYQPQHCVARGLQAILAA